jgi:hypothetical protein
MKQTSIKNISVQKKDKYCVLHSLINGLQDKRFLKFMGNEEFIGGKPDVIDFAIEKCGYPKCRMETIFKIEKVYGIIPNNLIFDMLSKPNKATKYKNIEYPMIPYFLTIKSGNSLHFVCALNVNGKVIYSDPTWDNFMEIESSSDLDRLAVKCIEVQRIVRVYKNHFSFIAFFADRLNLIEPLFKNSEND